ncbi:hypothetical protein [Candidatus Aquiluna sp. UB-MaderosW2red]|uniref:hypothetical protein n=1 Tax=Candidatus Aquiluna sp. UB-MaderosW2red TaxID=1855377 RepID=UPI000875BB58|nr:hypothetical protein [Candidatus Aquiluna sp. UB-MaderosW2red]SCX09668.1 hypothetical protein SAMN05216534_0946 [Candidatus Aquiluna sp. UB-MaderosW2red]
MPQEFNRFEIVRKGYDPAMVEREINEINSELVRLNELTVESQTALKNALASLEEAQLTVSQTEKPNFAALGSKAAMILSNAQLIATELEQNSQIVAQQITARAELAAVELGDQAESNYEATIIEANRRASRILNIAESEAKQILEQATKDSQSLTRANEIQNAQARGLAATEVAALRATTKREIDLLSAKLEADYAAKVNLITNDLDLQGKLKEKQQAKLEAALAARRLDAEQEYQTKHQEAVATTQGYLESAIADLSGLNQSIAGLRLEIETLELQAASSQRTILQEARDQAEALLHAAQIESRNLTQLANLNAKDIERKAEQNITLLQNQTAAIETYLENLRNLVTEQLNQGRDHGTAH